MKRIVGRACALAALLLPPGPGDPARTQTPVARPRRRPPPPRARAARTGRARHRAEARRRGKADDADHMGRRHQAQSAVRGRRDHQPGQPGERLEFRPAFTDRANQFVMNQALLTVQRPTDPKSPDLDFGFKFQALYGSDARYTSFMGELNQPSPAGTSCLHRGQSATHLPRIVPRRHRREGRAIGDAARLRDDRPVDQPVLLAFLYFQFWPAAGADRHPVRHPRDIDCRRLSRHRHRREHDLRRGRQQRRDRRALPALG